MIEILKKLTISLFVLGNLSGCATVQPSGAHNEEYVDIDAETATRKRNTLLTIGGILLLGAIIANEAENNVEGAVRDAARP